MPGAMNFFVVFLLGNAVIIKTETHNPTLRLEPEQPAYIAGEALSLSCIADRPLSITGYSFFKDALLIANNSASNRLDILALDENNSGIYFCTYYQEAVGMKPESNYIKLKVFERPPAPTLSVEPQRKVFVEKQSVVIRCHLPGQTSATEVNLYKNGTMIYKADNFGVLSLTNAEKENTGSYTCQYKTVISGRTVDSHPSSPATLVVIDPPPTPILRYAYSLWKQSKEVEIVCEIPNPLSTFHEYHLYRNGGEIKSSQANQFVLKYSLEFDGCYFCRTSVNILGEEILSRKSDEQFLTLEEKDRRSCQMQNSTSVPAYGLSREGIKLYGSVLIGKLIVLISILIISGIHLLVIYLRHKKSQQDEQSAEYIRNR